MLEDPARVCAINPGGVKDIVQYGLEGPQKHQNEQRCLAPNFAHCPPEKRPEAVTKPHGAGRHGSYFKHKKGTRIASQLVKAEF